MAKQKRSSDDKNWQLLLRFPRANVKEDKKDKKPSNLETEVSKNGNGKPNTLKKIWDWINEDPKDEYVSTEINQSELNPTNYPLIGLDSSNGIIYTISGLDKKNIPSEKGPIVSYKIEAGDNNGQPSYDLFVEYKKDFVSE